MSDKRCTELRICDLKDVILQMCPTRIFINRKLIWDDYSLDPSDTMLKRLDAILSKENLVRQLKFDIDDYHHSIVHIETTNKTKYIEKTYCKVKF